MTNSDNDRKRKLIKLLKKRIASNASQTDLSEVQKLMWLHQYEYPKSYAYNVVISFIIHGTINIRKAQACWEKICRKHEILTSHYPLSDNKPITLINRQAIVEVQLTKLLNSSEHDIKKHIIEYIQQPFNLENNLLIKINLFKVGKAEHVFISVMHHIITDFWSCGILLRDFISLYNSEDDEIEKNDLNAKKINYSNFVEYENMKFSENKLKEFWLNNLESPPLISRITPDYEPTRNIIEGETLQIQINKKLTHNFKKIIRENDISLFSSLISLYSILLFKYRYQEDLIIGSTSSRRSMAKFSEMVGCAMNPIPIRFKLTPDLTCLELFRKTKKHMLDVSNNDNFQFSSVLSSLKIERIGEVTPLYQMGFELQQPELWDDFAKLLQNNSSREKIKLGDLTLSSYILPQQETQLDITLEVSDNLNGLLVSAKYKKSLYKKETIHWLLNHFKFLIENISSYLLKPIKDISLTTNFEKKLLLDKWNKPSSRFFINNSYYQLFQETAKRYPDNIAVEFEDLKISYKDLCNLANRISKNLLITLADIINYKKDKNLLIIVSIPKSIDLISVLLAIFQAGAAYLPIEVDYPGKRVNFIVADSKADAIVTVKSESKYLRNIIDDKIPVLSIENLKEEISKNNKDRIKKVSYSLHQLAYVIYTSGSTGRPKGVMIEQAGLLNRILWMQEKFNLHPHDRVLHKTPATFDVSVWELFWPIITGATLVIAKQGSFSDPFYLSSVIKDKNITDVHFVPAMLDIFIAHNLTSCLKNLNRIFCSGEVLPINTLRQLAEKLKHTQIYNLYGPTEASIDVTYYHCFLNNIDNFRSVPIGRPIANIKILILDESLNIAPINTIGEICITGIGLARGYINNLELTKSKFIANPYTQNDFDKRIYRTGDLGRWLPEGILEFTGRLDDQVKIRGHRIELNEIVSVLQVYPQVLQASVLVKTINGDKKLIAYIVKNPEKNIILADLREYLSEYLPNYMIPELTLVQELPLTSSGKIDKKLLEDIGVGKSIDQQSFSPPQTETQKLIARIWASVLKKDISTLSIYDNFFDLGGDSLLSIRVVAKARQSGLSLTPQLILQHQTIDRIATAVSYLSCAIISQEEIVGKTPLTPIQKWFFSTEKFNYSHFNQSLLCEINCAINEDIFKESLILILSFHDILRSHYYPEDNTWNQIIENSNNISKFLKFKSKDLSNLSLQEAKKIIKSEYNKCQTKLNITDGPIILSYLFTLNKNKCQFFLVIHHLVIDLISWQIILEDLENIYQQLLKNGSKEKIQMPIKTHSFKDWSFFLQRYANSSSIKEELDYWHSHKENIEKSAVNFNPFNMVDHPDKLNNFCAYNSEKDFSTFEHILSDVNTEYLIEKIPKSTDYTPSEILLTALGMALGEVYQINNLYLDLEHHGREIGLSKLDLSKTVGWFTSLYPFYISLKNNIQDTLSDVKSRLSESPYHGIGYGILKYLCNDASIKNLMKSFPKSPIVFNYFGKSALNEREGQLFTYLDGTFISSKSPDYVNSYLIEINGYMKDDSLRFSWRYSKAFFNKRTIVSLASVYFRNLEDIINIFISDQDQHPGQPLVQGRTDKAYLPLAYYQAKYFARKIKDYNYFATELLIKCNMKLDAFLLEKFAHCICENNQSFFARFIKKKNNEWKHFLSDSIGSCYLMTTVDCHDVNLQDFERFLLMRCDEVKGKLNISSGPVFVYCLFHNCPDGVDRLYLVGQHLFFDYYSLLIILGYIHLLYQQHIKNEILQIPPDYKTNSYTQWLLALNKYGKSAEHMAKRNFWHKLSPLAKSVPIDTKWDIVTFGDLEGYHAEIVPKELLHSFLSFKNKSNIFSIENILITAFSFAIYFVYHQKIVTFCWADSGRTALKNVDISQTTCCALNEIPFVINLTNYEFSIEKNNLIAILTEVKNQVLSMKNHGLDFQLLFQNSSFDTRKKIDALINNYTFFNYFSDVRDNFESISTYFSRADERTGLASRFDEYFNFRLVVFAGIQDQSLHLFINYIAKHYKMDTIMTIADKMKEIALYIVRGILYENW